MKLKLISALSIMSVISLYSMQEDLSVVTINPSVGGISDFLKPDVDLQNPEFEHFSDSEDEDTPGKDSFLDATCEKEKDAALSYINRYVYDESYVLIPAKDRVSFMKQENELINDTNSFYHKYSVLDTKNARQRYDLLQQKNKKYYTRLCGQAIGITATLGIGAAAIAGVLYWGNHSTDGAHITFLQGQVNAYKSLLDEAIALAEKGIK